MNTRQLRLLFALLLLISLSSCTKPTYSKQKVKESVVTLCKDEYGLDVDVKIVGSTLGVFIPIQGLVSQDLNLNQKASEKIEDVALSIHRVTMSTDRPLKFYTLTARDTNIIGAEFVLTGSVYDVVRVRLLDISRGEYHKRIIRDFKFNPVIAGEVKIRETFQALNEGFALTESVKSVSYPIYSIGKEGSQKIEIVEILSKEISAHEGLFYVKTEEYYEVLPGFEMYSAIFPQGFKNEYLILVDISMFPNPIKEIVPKYFYSDGEIRERDLKEAFSKYKDTGYIGTDGLPKRELETDWFLSRQIERRIGILFHEDKRLKERFMVQTFQGLINNKIFRFKFSITSDRPSDKDDEIIFSSILRLAGRTFHRYTFEDFEGIELIDKKPGGKRIYLSKKDLERFRRGWLKIKEVLSSRL